MNKEFFPPRPVRAKALPQYMEALRAGDESALADFHELSKGFIPLRNVSLKQIQGSKTHE